jgi:tetratricopeptide (TPR) repeat protein
MNPIIMGISSAIFVLCTCCGTTFAAKTVVTAEGKYVMGDLDTKQNAKALALMEAKKMSLEKAGTYIESISEVREYQLTKDQVNSLAAGIMSIEILKEDWKMSGENMVLVLSVRATIDTSNLKSRISSMEEYQGSEGNKEIMAQLASLQKELADLKAEQAAIKGKAAPTRQMKEKNEEIINKMTSLDNLEEGHAALRVRRWNEAIAAFQRALDINPKQAEAYAGMSLAYHATKKPEKANEMVEKALNMNPKSATGHFAMAKIMFGDGKYDKALESINRAIELYQKSPYYFLNRGNIYMKLRHRELALKDYEQACRMNLPEACRTVSMVKRNVGKSKGK